MTTITQNSSKSSRQFWIGFFTVVGIIAFTALAIIANIFTFGLPIVITGVVGAALSFIGFVVNWLTGRWNNQTINSELKQNVNNRREESEHHDNENSLNKLQPKKKQKLTDHRNNDSYDPFSGPKSENNGKKKINENSGRKDKEKVLILKNHELYKLYLDKRSEYRSYEELVKNEPGLINALAKDPAAYTLYNNRKDANLLKAMLPCAKPAIAEIIVGYHAKTTSLDLLLFEEILLLTTKSFEAAQILLDNLKNTRHLNDHETVDLLYNITAVHGRYRCDFADSVLEIVEGILTNGKYKERQPYHASRVKIMNLARQQKDRTICNIITNQDVTNVLLIHLKTKDISEIVLAYLWDEEKDKEFKESIARWKGLYADIKFKDKRIFLIPAQVLLDMMGIHEKKNGRFESNNTKSSTNNMLSLSKGRVLAQSAFFNQENKEIFERWVKDVEEGNFCQKYANNIITTHESLVGKGLNGKESDEFLISRHLFHIICSMFDNSHGYSWDFFKDNTPDNNESNGNECPYYQTFSYN